MPERINSNYAVVISSLEEQNKLYQFCLKHNIPIPYPELFKNGTLHHLWEVSKNGVGLIGTISIRGIPTFNTFHSIEDLENAGLLWFVK